jgi:hypothetical protein
MVIRSRKEMVEINKTKRPVMVDKTHNGKIKFEKQEAH